MCRRRRCAGVACSLMRHTSFCEAQMRGAGVGVAQAWRVLEGALFISRGADARRRGMRCAGVAPSRGGKGSLVYFSWRRCAAQA